MTRWCVLVFVTKLFLLSRRVRHVHRALALGCSNVLASRGGSAAESSILAGLGFLSKDLLFNAMCARI